MRRILFVIIALALKSILYAQDGYRPFVEEGKSWKYYIEATTTWWSDTDKQTHRKIEYINSILTIKGDTIVDDIEYKKVYHDGDHSNFGYSPFFMEL